jgi:hypothetical protein
VERDIEAKRIVEMGRARKGKKEEREEKRKEKRR